MIRGRLVAAFAGFRIRVFLVLLSGVVFAGAGFEILVVTLTRQWLHRELDSRASSLATQVAERIVTPLLVNDRIELNEEVRRAALESDVLAAAIYGPGERPVAYAAHDDALWRRLGSPEPEERAAEKPHLRTRKVDGLTVRDIVVPVIRERGATPSAADEASELFGLARPAPRAGATIESVGSVRLVISTRRLEAAVRTAARAGLVVLFVALVLGLIAVSLLLRVVVRPLREAGALAREIAEGHLERRLPVRSRDELGALAESLNTMAGALLEARREAQNEAAALRTATEAVVEIARGARDAPDPRGVFGVVAVQVRRVTGCQGVALAIPGGPGLPTRFAHFNPAPPWGGLRVGAELDPASPLAALSEDGTATRVAIEPGGGALARGLFADGYRSALIVPLALEGGGAAVLLLASKNPQAFPPSERGVVAGLASHLSAALHASQLSASLERAIEELERTRDYLVKSEMLRVAGEMASGVAHEFNNVLGAILGRAQLLRRRGQDNRLGKEELSRALEVIERAAQDGSETVRRLRHFGRPADAPELALVDLDGTLRDAVEFTRPRWENEAQATGRAIEVEIHSPPGAMVAGRGSELREVFTNLILNAVDALPQGGTIRLSTRLAAERVLATVEDDGVGMNEETKRRLFEPFFTTKGPNGSGLGLSVVYGIIRSHGGTIEVESEPGAGTRVALSFPRAVASELPIAPVKPRPELLPGTLEVLVVDDEPAVRDLLRDLAVMLGHHVVVCDSARAALEEFRPGRFDLVLTDLGMPEVTGWQLAESIRAGDPAVTVAFVTGWGDEVSHEDAARSGADAVVPKPFGIEDIELVVQLALQRKATREAA